MDALSAAAPIARFLVALGESKQDGELWLRRRGTPARVSLIGGRITSVVGVECEPLGDLLRARGELGHACHAFEGAAGAHRIGARLIAVGAASGAAVDRALHMQLVRRLAHLLRSPVRDFKLTPCAPGHPPAAPWAVDPCAAVWAALLVLAAELPRAHLRELAEAEVIAPAAASARRADALARVLTNGALEVALDALGASALLPPAGAPWPTDQVPNGRQLPPVLHVLHASLRSLGAVRGSSGLRPGARTGFALLLRKRRELERKASAQTLLDLPGTSGPEHARRALRRLAGKLHPDRFAASDARLEALFTETLAALTLAEHRLRAET